MGRPGSEGAIDACPYVVGIGASAGGLQPLETFFSNVDPGRQAAYVLVQHLSPNHKSLMPELLARHTRLRLHRVVEDCALEPDTIFLLPPKKNGVIVNGRLCLLDQDLSPGHALPFPINTFLESLALSHGDRAVGVILSGTGTDGTHGIRAIHEAGGLVLVQDPESAEFDGMPRSALATGLAHYKQPPDILARSVQEYIDRRAISGVEPSGGALGETNLEEIVRLLGTDEGVDFSDYRETTIVRRIERRMFIAGHPTIEEYTKVLEDSPEERQALQRDLLISVTRFFRDTGAWSAFREQVLPKLLREIPDGEPVRLWVTACSTGEEAYSLGISVLEALAECGRTLPVKIFATDVNRSNIEQASEGLYPESILSDVPPALLSRHFTREDNGYRISHRLRKMVVFAQHDLTRDAPFGRVHLVMCRNVLIYMQPNLQRHVLANLHYALRLNGLLFLGGAENLGALEDEFEVVEARWKIFRKRRDVLVPLHPRSAANFRVLERPESLPGRRGTMPAPPDALLGRAMESLVQERNAIFLIVDQNNCLLYVYGRADELLRVPTGRNTMDVTRLLHPDLALAVSTAIQRSARTEDPMLYGHVPVGHGPAKRTINVEARFHPENRRSPAFHTVLLQDAEPRSAPPHQAFEVGAAATERAQELERDLQLTRESLQATIEELETANEEQQSSNEELMASNEELQSTNEELQSVNEELHTVNAEYQQRIRELIDLNNDIDNLLRCTNLATVFLDTDLRIRKFTPAAREIFHFEDQDIGRPVTDLTHNLLYPNLRGDLMEVLHSGLGREHSLTTTENRHVLARFYAYRSADNEIEGVVLTFVDVTDLQSTQYDLLQSTQDLERLYRAGEAPEAPESVDAHLLVIDDDETDVHGIRRMLGRLDGSFTLETATNLAEARDKLSAGEFDLVLLDHRLPDGESRDILRAPLDVPILLLAGTGQERLAPETLRWNVCDFIVKGPTDYDAPEIGERIVDIVTRRHAERSLRQRIGRLRQRIGRVDPSDSRAVTDS